MRFRPSDLRSQGSNLAKTPAGSEQMQDQSKYVGERNSSAKEKLSQRGGMDASLDEHFNESLRMAMSNQKVLYV